MQIATDLPPVDKRTIHRSKLDYFRSMNVSKIKVLVLAFVWIAVCDNPVLVDRTEHRMAIAFERQIQIMTAAVSQMVKSIMPLPGRFSSCCQKFILTSPTIMGQHAIFFQNPE